MSDDFFAVRVLVRAVFEPKEDITAFELAQIIPFLFGARIYEDEWEKVSWTRHCRRIDAMKEEGK